VIVEVAVNYAENTPKTLFHYIHYTQPFLLFMNIREIELFRMRRRVV